MRSSVARTRREMQGSRKAGTSGTTKGKGNPFKRYRTGEGATVHDGGKRRNTLAKNATRTPTGGTTKSAEPQLGG